MCRRTRNSKFRSVFFRARASAKHQSISSRTSLHVCMMCEMWCFTPRLNRTDYIHKYPTLSHHTHALSLQPGRPAERCGADGQQRRIHSSFVPQSIPIQFHREPVLTQLHLHTKFRACRNNTEQQEIPIFLECE